MMDDQPLRIDTSEIAVMAAILGLQGAVENCEKERHRQACKHAQLLIGLLRDERKALQAAALPPSSGCVSCDSDKSACVPQMADPETQSGWEAGAEAMRAKAIECCYAAISGALQHYGFAETVGADMAIRRIRALPLPPRPADSGGWQPIETAPGDGSLILVCGGRRSRADIVPADGEFWRLERRGGSVTVPTHWQPLPPPPSKEGV